MTFVDTRTFTCSIHKTYITSYNYVQLNMIFLPLNLLLHLKDIFILPIIDPPALLDCQIYSTQTKIHL